MIRILEQRSNVIELGVSDKLHHEELESVTPQLEAFFKNTEKPRLLLTCADFKGWEASALLEDIRFIAENRKVVDRIAVVGSQTTVQWLTNAVGFIFDADVRYFQAHEFPAARDWVYSDLLAEKGADTMGELALDETLRDTFPASDPPAY